MDTELVESVAPVEPVKPTESVEPVEVAETVGDKDMIKCPHCGKNNEMVCRSRFIPIRGCLRFRRICFYCKKVVYYRARYEVKVIAYTKNPFS